MNKPFMTYKVTIDEMDQFTLLLNHGLDVQTMITLSFKQHEKIIEQLNRGISLVESICSHQKETYFKNILSLSYSLSLKDSISCAKDIKNNSIGLLDDFFKQCTYPIFIIIFSFFMILFFSNSIMPSMMVYSTNQSLPRFISLLKWLYMILFVCIFFGILLSFLFYFKKDLLSILFQYSFSKYLKIYFTLHFSLLFETFLSKGLSTMQSITLISNMEQSSFSYIFSSELYHHLMKGASFVEALQQSNYVDPQFIQFVKMGEQSSDMVSLLHLYRDNRIFSLKQIVKKVSNSIQIFSYSTVGILVIVVYQIMLFPLNMLSNF